MDSELHGRAVSQAMQHAALWEMTGEIRRRRQLLAHASYCQPSELGFAYDLVSSQSVTWASHLTSLNFSFLLCRV